MKTDSIKRTTLALALIAALLAIAICAGGAWADISDYNADDIAALIKIRDDNPQSSVFSGIDFTDENYVASMLEVDWDHSNSSDIRVTALYLDIMNLESLDVSKLTALVYLDCNNNQLTELKLGDIAALTYLRCYSNNLTALDVSKLTSLTDLRCYYNQLTELKLGDIAALTYLDCDYNNLTSLDVSKLTALTELYCYNNQLTELKLGDNTELYDLGCDSNKLAALNLEKLENLRYLYCGNNQLAELNISNNTQLTSLGCGLNKLTTLDVSNNTQLTDLYCDNNPLVTLDIGDLGKQHEAEIYMSLTEGGSTELLPGDLDLTSDAPDIVSAAGNVLSFVRAVSSRTNVAVEGRENLLLHVTTLPAAPLDLLAIMDRKPAWDDPTGDGNSPHSPKTGTLRAAIETDVIDVSDVAFSDLVYGVKIAYDDFEPESGVSRGNTAKSTAGEDDSITASSHQLVLKPGINDVFISAGDMYQRRRYFVVAVNRVIDSAAGDYVSPSGWTLEVVTLDGVRQFVLKAPTTIAASDFFRAGIMSVESTGIENLDADLTAPETDTAARAADGDTLTLKITGTLPSGDLSNAEIKKVVYSIGSTKYTQEFNIKFSEISTGGSSGGGAGCSAAAMAMALPLALLAFAIKRRG